MSSARVGRPLAFTLGASALIQLLAVVTGVVLARELGPGPRGELAAAVLWYILLTEILSLGLLQATTYEAARDRTRADSIGSTSLLLALILGTVVIAVGFVVLPVVLEGYSSDAVDSARLFLLSAPFGLGALFLTGLLNGINRYGAVQVLRVTYVLTAAAGLVALALIHHVTVRNAVYCFIAGNVVTLLTGLALVAPAIRRVTGADRETAASLLRYGIRTQSSRVTTILNERLGLIVVSIALGAVSLGLYTVALTLTSLSVLVGASAALVALPAMAQTKSKARRRQIAQALIPTTLLGTAVITIPLLALTPQVVELFFGPEFKDSVDIARLLLLAAVIISTNRAIEGVLQGIGLPLVAGKGELIALVANAVGLAVLLPLLGLTGAGLASLLAFLISSAFVLRRAAGALGMPPRSLLIPDRNVLDRARQILRMPRRAPTPEIAAEEAETETAPPTSP